MGGAPLHRLRWSPPGGRPSLPSFLLADHALPSLLQFTQSLFDHNRSACNCCSRNRDLTSAAAIFGRMCELEPLRPSPPILLPGCLYRLQSPQSCVLAPVRDSFFEVWISLPPFLQCCDANSGNNACASKRHPIADRSAEAFKGFIGELGRSANPSIIRKWRVISHGRGRSFQDVHV